MPHAHFQHERLRLSDKSIRLVQIHGSSSVNDILSLRITQFAIHKRPPYAAISYTWGSAIELRDIRINGHPFRVHANLWHLLRHLQKRGESRFLWIDALCIDQAHLPERNFHVQLMSRIYDEAEFVTVWLGLPSDERREARAMEFVQEMAKHRPGRAGASFRDMYLSTKAKERWVNLLRLCELKYWTRCWIIQEFLQAKRIEVLCGTAHLEWTYFDKVFMDIRQLETHPSYLATELKAFLGTVPSRLTARRLLHRTSRLEELLHEFYDSNCTEPRDKVYGLLGIAEDCGEQPGTGYFYGPQPDYAKHLVQVYFDVLCYLRDSSVTRKVAPSTALLLQKSLSINALTISDYVAKTPHEDVQLELSRSALALSPDYISPACDLIPGWTSIRDLKQKLEYFDWSTYVGWEMQRPASRHSIPHHRSSSLSITRTSSPRPVVASLPSDLIPNALGFADSSPLMTYLLNYPDTLSFHLPLELLNTHIEDKRLVSNMSFLRPTLIFESSSSAQPVRLGFACTNARKGDYILQFNGLDIALIGRRIGYTGMQIVGRAVMIKHEGLEGKHKNVHPACSQGSEQWISPCLEGGGQEGALEEAGGIETDPISLFEILRPETG